MRSTLAESVGLQAADDVEGWLASRPLDTFREPRDTLPPYLGRMRLFASAVLAITLTSVASGGGRVAGAVRQEARASPKQPPAVLTALPAIGTVYWRADCAKTTWAIGMKMFRTSATDHLSFQLGRRTFTRVVQPGESVWFPFASNKLQLLRVVQPTEPGTLRATVKVNFGVPEPGRAVVPHCYSYVPPRLSVEIYPR